MGGGGFHGRNTAGAPLFLSGEHLPPTCHPASFPCNAAPQISHKAQDWLQGGREFLYNKQSPPPHPTPGWPGYHHSKLSRFCSWADRKKPKRKKFWASGHDVFATSRAWCSLHGVLCCDCVESATINHHLVYWLTLHGGSWKPDQTIRVNPGGSWGLLSHLQIFWVCVLPPSLSLWNFHSLSQLTLAWPCSSGLKARFKISFIGMCVGFYSWFQALLECLLRSAYLQI